MVERLVKRNEGLSSELGRISQALTSLSNCTADTYAVDNSDVPALNAGLSSVSNHLDNAQGMLDDEARAWDEGVVEDFKRVRDCLVSVRDMFDRKERLDRDNIPQLEKRIKNNEEKLVAIRARPEGQGKPGEAERVEEAIFKVS